MRTVDKTIHVNRQGDAARGKVETASVGKNLELSFDASNSGPRNVNVRSKDGNELKLQVGVGVDYASELPGHRFEVRGDQLFINDREFDFQTGRLEEPPAAKADTPAKKLAALKQRFPGVKFVGDVNNAGLVSIDKDVTIAKGATIELAAGLKIADGAKIGKNAKIRGGEIYGSAVDGTVNGGKIWDSHLEAGSVVNGGNLELVHMEQGSKVNGGNITQSTLHGGSKVDGGHLFEMELGANTTITDGRYEDFAVRNAKLDKGTHLGGLNQSRSSGYDERSPSYDKALGMDRDLFQSFVQQTLAQLGAPQQGPVSGPQPTAWNPNIPYQQQGAFQMDHQAMMNTYDPRMTGYPQQHPTQAYVPPQMQAQPQYQQPQYQMPPGLFGSNQGEVQGQKKPMSGLGKAALIGVAGLAGMSMFGYPLMGLGMGLGGLGGFNWFAW